MHSIGNEHDAQTIYYWVRGHENRYGKPSCVEQESAPYGWEFVGSGSFRSVWLSPEGVVYKVEHGYEYDYQSEEEINNLKRVWERGAPQGCRLPKFDKYIVDDRFVVAMELIKGVLLYEYGGPEREELYGILSDVENDLSLNDMHDENALVDEDGYLVPVDFGC